MLDEEHEEVALPDGDVNAYTLGSINGHNIVIACMPDGQPGGISASQLVAPLKRSFPKLQIHLFVGIGGGVPRSIPSSTSETEIFLGDVVMGWPQETGAPAVVQYDFGRALVGGNFEVLSALDKLSRQVLNALTKFMSDHDFPGNHFSWYLERTRELKRLAKPTLECDNLFKANYFHVSPEFPTCDSCSQDEIVARRQRSDSKLVFHQGTILSADKVVKDAELRDKLSHKYRSSRRHKNTDDAL